MKNVLFLLSISLLYSCQPKTVSTSVSSGKINRSAPYKWSSLPRTLLISEDFSVDEITNIKEMSTAWKTEVANKEFIRHGGVNQTTNEVSSAQLNLNNLGKDNIDGIYKITHWPNELSGAALAVTQIWGYRHHVGKPQEYVEITNADILLNEDFYNFRTGEYDEDVDNFDLRTVMLHEMGHYLGLDHRVGNSVMIETIDPETQNREPKPMDASDLSDRYGLTLGLSAGSNIIYKPLSYEPDQKVPGQPVRLIIELMANGECVHKEDGVTIGRHPAKIR